MQGTNEWGKRKSYSWFGSQSVCCSLNSSEIYQTQKLRAYVIGQLAFYVHASLNIRLVTRLARAISNTCAESNLKRGSFRDSEMRMSDVTEYGPQTNVRRRSNHPRKDGGRSNADPSDPKH